MSKPAFRRLYSTRRAGRLAMGALVGELLGAVGGLLLAPRGHVEATIASAKPAYSNPSDTSDDDDFDPKVAWPVLGSVAGLVIGLAAVGVGEAFRQGGSVDVRSRRAEETPR